MDTFGEHEVQLADLQTHTTAIDISMIPVGGNI